MLPTSVFVVFKDTPEAHREICFAADVARRLHIPLHMLVPGNPDLKNLLPINGDYHEEQMQRIRIKAAQLTNQYPLQAFSVTARPLASYDFPSNALVVGNANTSRRMSAAMLVPFDKPDLHIDGKSEFILPFGNHASGLHAAKYGLGLALAFGARVLLYHATWKIPGCASSSPEDHMCPKAKDIRVKILALAHEKDIPARVIIETPADVTERTCRIALTEACALFVMARGRDTLFGNYVDRILARTPIPVLVAPETQEAY